MMNRSRKLKIIAAVILAISLIWGTVLVNGAGPGSEDDPIVSKSYVDTKATFKAVQVAGGQKVIGDEGTEIILRSGVAQALGNGANGVSDLTGGKDLMSGVAIQENHLLLVPRKDGRGIVAVTEIWVMVKGNYTLN